MRLGWKTVLEGGDIQGNTGGMTSQGIKEEHWPQSRSCPEGGKLFPFKPTKIIMAVVEGILEFF